MINLSGLKFEHVMSEEHGYVTQAELTNILGVEVNALEYHKFKCCVTPAYNTLSTLAVGQYEGPLHI